MKIIEIWKPVNGYEGLYEVSNCGRVRNKNGVIKKQQKTKLGYYYVNLYKDGKEKNHSIHRLVAEAFIPNPNNFDEVNHKDETPSNNFSFNLEWCSHKYNMNYGSILERKSKSMKNFIERKKESNRFVQYTLKGDFIKEWFDVDKCSKETCIPKDIIVRCLDGKRKYAASYIFKWDKCLEIN